MLSIGHHNKPCAYENNNEHRQKPKIQRKKERKVREKSVEAIKTISFL